MNRVLEERKDDISAAMRGLCDAVEKLDSVTADCFEAHTKTPAGDEHERVGFVFRLASRHGKQALDMVNGIWIELRDERYAGSTEVQTRIRNLIAGVRMFGSRNHAKVA